MKNCQLTDFMIEKCNQKRSEDVISLRLRRKAYLQQYWSPTIPMWILLWYSDSQLFVWLFKCEFQKARETVTKRTLGISIKNGSIDLNTASDHAGLNFKLYGLNFAHCEHLSKSVCARCLIKLHSSLSICSNKSSPICWVLFVRFHYDLFIIFVSFEIYKMCRI